jgi:hypothetical protein
MWSCSTFISWAYANAGKPTEQAPSVWEVEHSPGDFSNLREISQI